MNEFVIMTDSCCDLPAELAEQMGLEVVPLSVEIGGDRYHNYLDGREIRPKTFYDRLRTGEMAVTSAVNVGEFSDCIEAQFKAGKDVLVLAFSSGLSTTYNSAVIAAEELKERYPDRKAYVVDTLQASMGQGMLAWLAAKEKAAGKSIEEVRDYAEEIKFRLCAWFTVNDLNHLKRGGRVSAATALVGTMLSVKPVLHVDDEGHLINVSKARGRQASLKALVDQMEALAVDPAGQTIFISHGDCLEDAELVADQIKERFGVKEVVISYVGPVIGAHTGPGVVALFFVGTKR